MIHIWIIQNVYYDSQRLKFRVEIDNPIGDLFPINSQYSEFSRRSRVFSNFHIFQSVSFNFSILPDIYNFPRKRR